MKRILSILLIVSMVACLCVGLTGCNSASKLKEEIVGTWISPEFGEVTFNQDGSFRGTLPFEISIDIDGVYTVNSGDQIIVQFYYSDEFYDRILDVELEGDKLTISYFLQGTSGVYTRKTDLNGEYYAEENNTTDYESADVTELIVTTEATTEAEDVFLALYDSDNWLSASGNQRIFTKSGAVKATNNKEYYNCIFYRHTKNCKPSTLKFFLEGNYSTVSGVYFSPKENATHNRTGQAFFEVYGDGELIYTSPVISAESLPESIEFSVLGVQKIEIVFNGSGSSVWGVDASNGYGDYAAISDLIAYK